MAPTSSTMAARNRRSLSPDRTAFTRPCGEPVPEEEGYVDDTSTCLDQVTHIKQMRNAIQLHKQAYPNSSTHCMGMTLPVLQSTSETVTECNAANDEKAHRMIVSLHLVSNILKSISSDQTSTQQYTSFYNKMTEDLQHSSCSLVCHSKGLSDTQLDTFVDDLLTGSGSPSNFRRNDESSFTNYQCIFLQTITETLSNLLSYYETTCEMS